MTDQPEWQDYCHDLSGSKIAVKLPAQSSDSFEFIEGKVLACEFVNGVPVHSLELDAKQKTELVLASVDYRITLRGSGVATEKVVSRAPSLTDEKSFSVFITLDSAEAGEDTFSGCLLFCCVLVYSFLLCSRWLFPLKCLL